MIDFKALNISEFLIQALRRMGISVPTPIQEMAIPFALEGRDILASAQTGTGKTIAYAIPVMTYLLRNPQHSALILAPTRELAAQVSAVFGQLLGTNNPSFHTTLLIGGEPMPKQLAQLRRNPRLVIATPGRLNDHLKRGTVSLRQAHLLVLDETDRMLDMGFSVQLDEIMKYLPSLRQTLMFSATLPQEILRLSQKYLTNPERLSVGSTTQAAPKIKQEIIRTPSSEKLSHLMRELDAREGSIIVFVKTKRQADQLTTKLRNQNHRVEAFHGDLQQRKRDRVIASFRALKCRVLVATDIAARGLDVPEVMHVINYELPQCPEDYIHRIGRTGRAGAEGNALCLISPEDNGKWKGIDRLMNGGAPDKGERREDRPLRASRPNRSYSSDRAHSSDRPHPAPWKSKGGKQPAPFNRHRNKAKKQAYTG